MKETVGWVCLQGDYTSVGLGCIILFLVSADLSARFHTTTQPTFLLLLFCLQIISTLM